MEKIRALIEGTKNAVPRAGADATLSIKTFRYSKGIFSSGWVLEELTKETEEVKKDKLKVLTYNVWFDQFEQEKRYAAIRDIIREVDADFVCLQEVIPAFTEGLWKDPFIQATYRTTEVKYYEAFYSTAILSKLPIEATFLPYSNTGMGRSLLYTLTKINGRTVAIGTTHLESMNSRKRRADQLKFATETLAPFETAILMGDFNLESGEDIIPNEWLDLWPSLHDIQQDKGFSMPEQNGYAAWRPDRIILKKEAKSQPISNSVIGKENVKAYGPDITEKHWLIKTPSDHFALVAEVALQ